MYVIVWEFIIAAENAAEFEAVYGPDGKWAKLFAASEAYVQTRLSHDTADPSRYFTMDFWDSRQAHEQFRCEHAREYEALDQACERLTLQETRLGEFDSG